MLLETSAPPRVLLCDCKCLPDKESCSPLLEMFARCHTFCALTEMVHVCLKEGRKLYVLLRREDRLNFFVLTLKKLLQPSAPHTSLALLQQPHMLGQNTGNQWSSGAVASFCCQCWLSASHSLGLEFPRQRGHVLPDGSVLPCL